MEGNKGFWRLLRFEHVQCEKKPGALQFCLRQKNTFRQTLWRIIPVSRWLETSIYKPYECFQQRRYPPNHPFFHWVFYYIIFTIHLGTSLSFWKHPKRAIWVGGLATPDLSGPSPQARVTHVSLPPLGLGKLKEFWVFGVVSCWWETLLVPQK